MTAIEERQKKIADGLSAAERAEKDLDLAKANASERIKEAKRAAAEVIEQANKRKLQIIDEARVEAEGEREKLSLRLKPRLNHYVTELVMTYVNRWQY